MSGPDSPFPDAAALTADLWNVLHDGTVDRVEGDVPGTVRLTVSCEYLRERYPDPGDRLVITLHGCTLVSYRPYDADVATTEFVAISAASPGILSAAEPTEVFGGDGVLRVEAAGFSLALDGGRAVTLDDLRGVAEAYWTEWASETG